MLIKTKMRVEYESTPIRHIAIQCPFCKNWFMGEDIAQKELRYSHQLWKVNCKCPICNETFEAEGDIEESSHPDIYKDVKKKSVKWE